MADTNEDKLDRILDTLEEIKEAQEELKEAVANISTPGRNYSVFDLDE